ncbi:SpoIIE family protein phosphatase [Streptomyces sp. NPDC059175]|uniref:SpoIIE family protein phosphatase n=1 Tax=unclassified Streptomyces TaxID=2593676 RepID=UPI0036CAD981
MTADGRGWFQDHHVLSTAEAGGLGGPRALEDFLRDAAAGVCVLAPDLRYVYANDAYRRITGESPDRLAGRSPGNSAKQYLEPAGLLAEVLSDGIPRGRVTGPGDGCRTTCVRLEERGTVVGVLCIVIEDPSTELQSELRLARVRSAAADEAVERIGTSLDERRTCGELAHFLTSWLGGAAAVELLPSLPAARTPALPSSMLRVAGAGPVELLGNGELEGAARSAADRAVGSGLPATEHGPGAGTAVLAVPLAASADRSGADDVIGVVVLARVGSPYAAHDLALARHAVRRAAVGVRHSREFAAEQRKAVDLQRALLTEPGKPHPNLQLATRYLPVGGSDLVGGDWFETVRLHYGRTLLVMGDVMGHGVEAAVEMNTYRGMLRDTAAADLPPHRVLRRLDLAIADTVARPATCLLVRIDPARGLGSFASAGHLPPVVFTRDGTADLVDVPAGPPLGTGLGGYELVTRELTADETLLLYTDGLVERRGEDIDASLARLTRVRQQSGTPVEELVDTVLRELDAEHAEDDVALLAARLRPRRSAG